MALYIVEIVTSTKSPKALHLISELSGMGVEDVRQRLRHLPLVVKDSIALAEAVSVDRQLRRMGLTTHVRKVEVSIEPYNESKSQGQNAEEIIIIPEADVKELPFQEQAPPPKPRVTRRIMWSPGRVRGVALFAAVVVLIAVGVIYLFSYSALRRNESDLEIAIDQWSHTLIQQEALLDRGMTPQQVLSKLDEIEGKVSRLLAILKSHKVARELKAKYQQARNADRGLLRDLEFRQKLDDAGYPIHPTCLIDQGMVRGVSDLPDGTRLRVQLYTTSKTDPDPLTTFIVEGSFLVVLDPILERTAYDAQATVAPYSQQPPTVQNWAQAHFALPEAGPGTAAPQLNQASRPLLPTDSVKAAAPVSAPSGIQSHNAASQTRSSGSRQYAVPTEVLRDSLADAGMTATLANALDHWKTTAQEADKYLQNGQANFLEAIYQRLITLEAQIDHMIHLLANDEARNRAVLMREDAYGTALAIRNDLQRWHDDFLARSNPLYLETAFRRELATKGFEQVDVTVQTTEKDAYTIDFRANKPETAALYAAIASAVTDEVNRTPINIQTVRLLYGGRQLTWNLDRLKTAAEALKSPDGFRRCTALMEGRSLE